MPGDRVECRAADASGRDPGDRVGEQARRDVQGMDRHEVGSRAERAAARALAARGYRVLAANVRSRGGEIDLVCLAGRVFVFCEVKARRSGGAFPPEEALTSAKRRRLERLAAAYLARAGRRDAAYRLELVAVDLDRDGLPTRLSVLPFA